MGRGNQNNQSYNNGSIKSPAAKGARVIDSPVLYNQPKRLTHSDKSVLEVTFGTTLDPTAIAMTFTNTMA